MSLQQYFEEISVLLDTAWALPLTGGKTVVDADRIRDILDDIKQSIPTEIEEAKNILADSRGIIERANNEAARILHNAEEKAKNLVASHVIVRQAEALAREKATVAENTVSQLKRATAEYIDSSLRTIEDNLAASLKEIRDSRTAFKANRNLFTKESQTFVTKPSQQD